MTMRPTQGATFSLVRRGLAPTLAVLAAILSPLYFSFMDLVSQGRIADAIPRQLDMDGRPLELRVSRVRMGAPVQIEIVVTAPQFMEGRYDHKMDPKFRVSIPVDWRPAPGETAGPRSPGAVQRGHSHCVDRSSGTTGPGTHTRGR